MMFDWAAQPFFTVITTFIFAPYFTTVVISDSTAGLAYWGFAASAAGVLIAIGSPLLGASADGAGPRKPWIAGFALIKIIGVAGLWFAVPQADSGIILQTVLLFTMATVAAEFSIVFNDSMMVSLVPPKDHGRISNLAWGLGYLGGMIMLIIVVGFLSAPADTGKTLLGLAPLFGLDPALHQAERLAGPLAAAWYLLFILPMFLFTPDRPRQQPLRQAVRGGLKVLWATIISLRQRIELAKFLIARMFYQDGLNGLLILGGAFAAGLFGWQIMEVGLFGIIINIVAIFGCGLASRLDGLWGSKTIILCALAILILATLGIISTGPGYTFFAISLDITDNGGLFATTAERVYLVYGCLVGLAFGPIQASSRSFLSRSVSAREAGRFFGLYALTGRATSFLAPLTVATLTSLSGSAHVGMSALIVFFVIGAVILAVSAYPGNDQ